MMRTIFVALLAFINPALTLHAANEAQLYRSLASQPTVCVKRADGTTECSYSGPLVSEVNTSDSQTTVQAPGVVVNSTDDVSTVDAPFSQVNSTANETEISAPFTSVNTTADETHVSAPFVGINSTEHGVSISAPFTSINSTENGTTIRGPWTSVNTTNNSTVVDGPFVHVNATGNGTVVAAPGVAVETNDDGSMHVSVPGYDLNCVPAANGTLHCSSSSMFNRRSFDIPRNRNDRKLLRREE